MHLSRNDLEPFWPSRRVHVFDGAVGLAEPSDRPALVAPRAAVPAVAPGLAL